MHHAPFTATCDLWAPNVEGWRPVRCLQPHRKLRHHELVQAVLTLWSIIILRACVHTYTHTCIHGRCSPPKPAALPGGLSCCMGSMMGQTCRGGGAACMRHVARHAGLARSYAGLLLQHRRSLNMLSLLTCMHATCACNGFRTDDSTIYIHHVAGFVE